MNRDKLLYDMNKLINSVDFKNKSVKFINDSYIDKKRHIVYAKVINNLNDLVKYYDTDHKPIIILSDDNRIIKLLGSKFLSKKWNCEKINNLTGFEFDYIIQVQASRINKYRVSNMTDILGLVVPTCYPSRALERLFSDESLTNLEPLKEVCTFLLNFQPPWNNDQINEVLERLYDHGFDYELMTSNYGNIEDPKHVSILKIRNDCVLLKKCKFYAFVDDDFYFKSTGRSGGQQYLDIVNYMMTHPKCGVVLTRTRNIKSDKIKLSKSTVGIIPIDNQYGTRYGLFLRSMYDVDKTFIYPNDLLVDNKFIGAGEDVLASANILSHGYYPARLDNIHVKNDIGGDHTGWDDQQLVKDNLIKYMREHYNPSYDFHSDEIISPDKYNGLVYTEELSRSVNKDYTGISYDDVFNEIKLIYDEDN